MKNCTKVNKSHTWSRQWHTQQHQTWWENPTNNPLPPVADRGNHLKKEKNILIAFKRKLKAHRCSQVAAGSLKTSSLSFTLRTAPAVHPAQRTNHSKPQNYPHSRETYCIWISITTLLKEPKSLTVSAKSFTHSTLFNLFFVQFLLSPCVPVFILLSFVYTQENSV